MNATAELPMSIGLDFAAIYRDHHRRVFNLCAYLLNSGEAAEDAAHEVFLRVQRKIETYNPDYSLSNWILKIASNYCVDLLRRRGLEKRLFGLDPSKVRVATEAEMDPSTLSGPLPIRTCLDVTETERILERTNLGVKEGLQEWKRQMAEPIK